MLSVEACSKQVRHRDSISNSPNLLDDLDDLNMWSIWYVCHVKSNISRCLGNVSSTKNLASLATYLWTDVRHSAISVVSCTQLQTWATGWPLTSSFSFCCPIKTLEKWMIGEWASAAFGFLVLFAPLSAGDSCSGGGIKKGHRNTRSHILNHFNQYNHFITMSLYVFQKLQARYLQVASCIFMHSSAYLWNWMTLGL